MSERATGLTICANGRANVCWRDLLGAAYLNSEGLSKEEKESAARVTGLLISNAVETRLISYTIDIK